MPQQLTNSVVNDIALAGSNTGNWVLQKEMGMNIVRPGEFAFLTLLGGKDIIAGGGQNKSSIREVKPLIKTEKVYSLKFEGDVYVSHPTEFTVNGAVTGIVAGTPFNLTLDSTEGLKPDDAIINHTTGDVYKVLSITSSTVVSCVSQSGTTNIADNEVLSFGGSLYRDGQLFNNGLVSTPQNNYNYIQTHVTEYGQGLIEKQIHRYPGEKNQLAVQRSQALIRQNHGRERAAIFGKRAANSSYTAHGTVYSTNGLLGWSSKTVDAGGTVTKDEWNTAVHPLIIQYAGAGTLHSLNNYGPNSVFNSLFEDNVRTSQEDKTYGSNVERVRTACGDIVLHMTDSMRNRTGEMIVFNPKMLTRKVLGELDNVHLEKINQSNKMAESYAYATAEGLWCDNPDSIIKVSNVTLT